MVTGALGYIGQGVVRSLHRRDIEVFAVVRTGSDITPIRDSVKEVIFWDLASEGSPEAIPEDIGCIYHLAAATQGSHFEMMMNTVVATDNLMRALADKKVGRFVLVSSFSVYKMTSLKRGSVLDETCPIEDRLVARDSYSNTKVRQEALVKKICAQRGLPLVIVRPGKIYGPTTYPIPPQMGLNIPGICYLYIGGRSVLPLTHVANCAEAIVLAGLAKGIEGDTFNIVDDDLPTQGQFVRLYRRHLGSFPTRIWVPYGMFRLMALIYEYVSRKTKGNLPPLISRYRADNLWKSLKYTNRNAKEKLHWAPQKATGEGLVEMFESVRDK
ncbi:MAG TPA: NAD-dependent epimerase/dehydratase family protein [Syntrophorhabdaceae bacterium]|nr:NAD-dependent epimerase/dehydratase family protein [Syntrophorhabdaceae bacterium]